MKIKDLSILGVSFLEIFDIFELLINLLATILKLEFVETIPNIIIKIAIKINTIYFFIKSFQKC